MKFNYVHLYIFFLSYILLLDSTSSLTYKNKLMKISSNLKDIEGFEVGDLIAKKRRSIQYYAHPSHSVWRGYWNTKAPHSKTALPAKKTRNNDKNPKNSLVQKSNLENKIASFKSYYKYQKRNFRTTNVQDQSSNSMKPLNNPEFKCDIPKLVQNLDVKYKILTLFNGEMSEDNTIRFYATKDNGKSYVVRAFFSGPPSNCTLMDNSKGDGFKENIKDCQKYKDINLRLKGEKTYTDVEFPVCEETNTDTSGNSFYYEIFGLPKGENLHDKCIQTNIQDYDDTNSCIPFLKTIATGAIHGVDVLNRGNTFIKHGNLSPKNIFLQITSEKKQIFLDNLMFSMATLSDTGSKPEVGDLNELGNTLLKIIAGTVTIDFVKDSKSGYEIYCKMLKFFKQNNVSVDLKSSFLGVPQEIKSGSSRVGSLEEFKEKFEGSIFNFIFYLKSDKANSSQALKSKYISSKTAHNDDDSPADY